MKKLKVLTTILLAFTLLPTFQSRGSEDFEITNTLNIDYKNGQEFVSVKETVEMKVFNESYFIPRGSRQSFRIQDSSKRNKEEERKFKLESLEVKDRYGLTLNHTVHEKDSYIEIETYTKQNATHLNDYSISIEYKTHDLINVNGNITNIYVPGIHPDTEFSHRNENGLSTTYTFHSAVTTDAASPEASYLQPQAIRTDKKTDKTIYSISQEDRIGTTPWLQLGNEQYYYFKTIQKTPKTDSLTPKQISQLSSLLSSNIFKLALPREFEENNQKLFIKSISPEPKNIERDIEGNLVATFEVPANEDTEIVIEGYISQSRDSLKQIPDLKMEEYFEQIKTAELSKYTKAEKYWEADSKTIKDIAKELSKDEVSILDLIKKDYDFVVAEFEYSNEKLEGENRRLGALAALSGGQTVCMEYADTLIAILRAQGIPARSAIGYGNDPTGIDPNISNLEAIEQKFGHQWVQVWIPQYGWLSVDPTWGEANRTYIGSDLDHILWYTVGSNSDEISDTIVYTADLLGNTDISGNKVYIQALNSELASEIKNAKSSEDILQEFGSNSNNIEVILKTTKIGRVLVFLLPIAAISFATILLTLGLRAIGARRTKRSRREM